MTSFARRLEQLEAYERRQRAEAEIGPLAAFYGLHEAEVRFVLEQVVDAPPLSFDEAVRSAAADLGADPDEFRRTMEATMAAYETWRDGQERA